MKQEQAVSIFKEMRVENVARIEDFKEVLGKHSRATNTIRAYLIRWILVPALSQYMRDTIKTKNKNAKNRSIHTKAYMVQKFFDQLSGKDEKLKISRSIDDEIVYNKVHISDIYQETLKQFKQNNALQKE